MPSFVIAQLEVFNKKIFVEYLRLVPKTIEAFEGKVIARGVSGTGLEGDWNPQNMVIIEFPSTERANEWWSSQMYSKVKKIRERSAETKMVILEEL
ncbi:MAG: DUF1330 domain-containing protein [Bacteroidota bacterium]